MRSAVRLSRRRRVARPAAPLALLAFVPLVLHASSAAGIMPRALPLPAPGSTLTASSATFTGLVFDGVVTVETTAGEVRSLQLTSSSARLTGLGLHSACRPVDGSAQNLRTDSATSAGSTSTAEAGFTLYALSVTATTGGATVTWTPDSPPPAQALGDPTLTDLTIELATLSAPSLSVPELRQSTSFCSG